MQHSLFLLVVTISVSTVISFSSPSRIVSTKNVVRMAIDPVTMLDSTHTLLDSSSSLLLNFLQRVDPDQAKGEFFFFFFGGSGALGIGAAQVPKIAAELDFINKLGGSPITKGGDDLDCNFIATLGYPEPLKIADVQKIIDDAPFVEKILAAGKKKSYMAQIGYLERQGFNDCFTGIYIYIIYICAYIYMYIYMYICIYIDIQVFNVYDICMHVCEH
jgi:hypothetical protein